MNWRRNDQTPARIAESVTAIGIPYATFRYSCEGWGRHSNATIADVAQSPYNCPCCGYRTLVARGANETCDRCLWTDDGQDNEDADVVRGGPNHELSLTKARQNFARLGVIAQRYLEPVKLPPRSKDEP